MMSKLYDSINNLWEFPHVLWEFPNVLWEFPNVLWEFPNVLWEFPCLVYWEIDGSNIFLGISSCFIEYFVLIRTILDLLRKSP